MKGWWNMHCFNALSEAQQDFLVTEGYLPIGYQPEADEPCPRPAAVAVETDLDTHPGPRFYCRPCALAYLQDQLTGETETHDLGGLTIVAPKGLFDQ